MHASPEHEYLLRLHFTMLEMFWTPNKTSLYTRTFVGKYYTCTCRLIYMVQVLCQGIAELAILCKIYRPLQSSLCYSTQAFPTGALHCTNNCVF